MDAGLEREVRCRACGATFAPPAWSALAIVERVDATDVRRVVNGWPDGTCVEVRNCGECGVSIVARAENRKGA